MGDRANIKIIQHDNGRVYAKLDAATGQAVDAEEPALFLYTHWGGHDLAKTLKKALMRGQSRWDDETYLARIIFNTMTKGDEDELTGFGISTYLGDNEHPILTVDCEKGTVSVEGRSLSFNAFVALNDGEVANFYK